MQIFYFEYPFYLYVIFLFTLEINFYRYIQMVFFINISHKYN